MTALVLPMASSALDGLTCGATENNSESSTMFVPASPSFVPCPVRTPEFNTQSRPSLQNRLNNNIHTSFLPIFVHTAKCDRCDRRNKSVIQRCATCSLQICKECMYSMKDGKHYLDEGAFEYASKPVRPQRKAARNLKTSSSRSAAGSGVTGVTKPKKASKPTKAKSPQKLVSPKTPKKAIPKKVRFLSPRPTNHEVNNCLLVTGSEAGGHNSNDFVAQCEEAVRQDQIRRSSNAIERNLRSWNFDEESMQDYDETDQPTFMTPTPDDYVAAPVFFSLPRPEGLAEQIRGAWNWPTVAGLVTEGKPAQAEEMIIVAIALCGLYHGSR